MDRPGAHRAKGVRRLIEEGGARPRLPPSYSPDLDPTEEAFSKIEAPLKKAAARAKEALVEAMSRALAAV